MSELRQDILTGEWVIFAGNRKSRPYDFIKHSIPKTSDKTDCQFCPGNEAMTPNAVYQNAADGEWTIRVFPNKYPAVNNDKSECCDEDFYTSAYGNGIHEVVVDTAEHSEAIHDFSVKHIAEVLKTIRLRYNEMMKNPDIKYVEVFKNCGPESGASLMHSHWQIIAVTVVPREQKVICERNNEYKLKNGKCAVCAITEYELDKKIRIIDESDNFAAYTPFASRMSYEIDIATKKHIKHYGDFSDEMLDELACMLKTMLKMVSGLRENICYNICFEDTPKDCDGHWFMRILPRMGNPAGFEYGTNSYINPVLPETAAEYYRNILVKKNEVVK